MAELLRFVQKSKMAATAILNWYFATLDHPRSLFHGRKTVLKFHVNSFANFRDMAVWKFYKLGLKRLFPPPQLTFWGDFDPKHYFSLSRPPKGTSLHETATASYELSHVEIGSAVFAVGDDKNKQESLANAEVSTRQPCWFKVIKGRRFWYQWKAHIRVPISN